MTTREKLCAPFRQDEIEWRIGRAGKKDEIWAMALAYVSSRAVRDRLDDVFGIDGWRDEYRVMEVPGGAAGIMCRLWFKSDAGDWLWREDGAQQTDMESFKGGISDALKRAAASLGIGRYLYKLDETFVACNPRKTKDFPHYARLKKEDGGDVFYWATPKLPGWALPDGQDPVGDRDLSGFKKTVKTMLDSCGDLELLKSECAKYKDEASSLGLLSWLTDQYRSAEHMIKTEQEMGFKGDK